MYKEERDLLEETKKIDECGREKFVTLEGNEKTIDIRGGTGGDRRRNRKGIRLTKTFHVVHGNNVLSAHCNGWRCLYKEYERCSVSKGMRGQCSNDQGKKQMSTPPPPPPLPPPASSWTPGCRYFSGASQNLSKR